MIDIESCLKKANEINYDTSESERILRKNILTGYIPKSLEMFRFISGKIAFNHDLFKGKGKYPGQLGDAGVYFSTNYGRILAMSSFNINPEEESFDIVQIQGTREEYLNSQEKRHLLRMPWDKSLITVIENCARECQLKRIRVASAHTLKAVKEGKVNIKTLTIRYNVAAIEKFYFPTEDQNWFFKDLE